uniref:Uncharacterized protein n=1 Tax=Microcebus murinus TaxID=30608 RepID=A0A8C5W2B2_MICMU
CTAAWHCPLCACLLHRPPAPERPAPRPGRTTCCPPSTHPAPTRGTLTFWAPGPRPRVLLVPRAPGPSSVLCAPHPAARAWRRAWHSARLPGSPARAGRTFRRGSTSNSWAQLGLQACATMPS